MVRKSIGAKDSTFRQGHVFASDMARGGCGKELEALFVAFFDNFRSHVRIRNANRYLSLPVGAAMKFVERNHWTPMHCAPPQVAVVVHKDDV